MAKRKPKIQNRIRSYRIAKGLSQKKLAFLLGMSAQQVSRWERGKAKPKTSNAIGLAVITDRPIKDIFSDYSFKWREKIKKRKKLLRRKNS